MSLDIVLVEPEIPQNTGNIARTCAAIGAKLHLVEPLGFSVTDRYLKRAGLDYWHELDITLWANLDEVMKWIRTSDNRHKSAYFCSTKGRQIYSDISYGTNTILFFGKETKGLPESLLMRHYDKCIRIPMLSGQRSLNLSNAVAIAAYEVLRQQGFAGFKTTGMLNTDDSI